MVDETSINDVQQSSNSSEQNMYTQSPLKTNLVLYIITIIISFGILTLLNAGLILFASLFSSLVTLPLFYILLSITSLIVGLVDAFILNKIAKTNKLFLLGGSVISFLSAAITSIYFSLLSKLITQISMLEAEGSLGLNSIVNSIGLKTLFGETIPNALLTGILIILFFNALFVIFFFKKEQRLIKDLLIYLYSFIVFLILYFLSFLIPVTIYASI